MSARRPIFNHLVAPLVGGPVLHDEAKQMLDAYCREVRTAAVAEAIEAARSECLTENTGTPAAYNQGVTDAIAAIGKLLEDGAR